MGERAVGALPPSSDIVDGFRGSMPERASINHGSKMRN
jgi:hypothetical protein